MKKIVDLKFVCYHRYQQKVVANAKQVKKSTELRLGNLGENL